MGHRASRISIDCVRNQSSVTHRLVQLSARSSMESTGWFVLVFVIKLLFIVSSMSQNVRREGKLQIKVLRHHFYLSKVIIQFQNDNGVLNSKVGD